MEEGPSGGRKVRTTDGMEELKISGGEGGERVFLYSWKPFKRKELRLQEDDHLTVSPFKDTYLVGTQNRAFSVAAPHLRNNFFGEVCLTPPLYIFRGQLKTVLFIYLQLIVTLWVL